MKKKNFKNLVYLFGAMIEIIGFGLLFKNEYVINLFVNHPVILGFLVMFNGYLLAISVRWVPPRN